ncbi:MAG: DUF2933 domain-containing protein [Betaproteobacteria bacterium]|nr:DUF2933 domain-containing protein [Betaproteobacteria bacterium]
MEWLSQNWVWLALGVGVLLFMMRRGGQGSQGSCCGGHAKSDKRPQDEGRDPASAGGSAEHQH